MDTLLRLNPRDLKACRLVCWEWHLFIRDKVWGSKAGRAKLERKLVDRWMNRDDLTATKIGEARGCRVYSVTTSVSSVGMRIFEFQLYTEFIAISQDVHLLVHYAFLLERLASTPYLGSRFASWAKTNSTRKRWQEERGL